MDYSNETRAEYLERNIAEVRQRMDMLQNRPWGQPIARECDELRMRAATMQRELHEIRPYKSVKNGDHYLVAHFGDFVVGSDGEWLEFPTEGAALNWISQQGMVAA